MKTLILFIAILSVSITAFAEDISVSSSVDNTTIELGSSTQLRVTLYGADSVPPVQFPKIEGLDIRYLGPATSVSIVNNKMSRSTTLVFRVIPLKTGQFQIPALSIPISGTNFSTEPITLSVTNSGTIKKETDSADSSATLHDKIFIVLSTPKNEVYFGEPVPVTLKLYINNLAVKNVQYPILEQDGFTMEPFNGEPERGQQVIGGVNYQFLEFKTFIYPTRTGDLSLGPAKMGANIMIQGNNARRQVPGDFGAFFDDSIFDEFMGRYEIKTLMLESANIGIKVLALPEEGKPANFTGGVGKYNFEVGVSPAEVKVGDPLTVRMRVNGDGNLKSVELPAFKDTKDFKAYDPKVTEEKDSKSLEQVVIPNHDRVDGLPAVSFSYFDPVEKKYFTLTKGPFPLTVTPLAQGEGPKVVGLKGTNTPITIQQPQELGQDIRFIKELPGTFSKKDQCLINKPWFIVLVVFGFLVWVGFFMNYLFQQRLNSDTRLARRLLAPRQAKNGLMLAESYLNKNDVRNFCDTLIRTLQEYFGNKLHVPQNTITPSVVLTHAKNIKKDKVDDLRFIFDECELVRFASAQIPESQIKTMLKKAREIIDYFERTYK